MYQRQAQADGNGREILWRIAMCRAQYHEQKTKGHDDFRDQSRRQRVAARGVSAIAIRGESARQIESRVAGCNDVQNPGASNASEDLNNDVRDEIAAREASTCP